MSKQFYRLRSSGWIALIALLAFSFPLTAAALQHQPAPPVRDSTVDQPSAHIEGEAPTKATEEEFQDNREKTSAPGRGEIPCGETAASMARGTSQTNVVYKLGKLLDTPEEYFGKTITVDGEMHRQFTDRVFTIEDDGFFRDHDMLVISMVPMSESVIPLQDSFERGKNVRVTGVLRPYDRAKLECLFGPLNLESREGHSFTKNPVLIIGYTEPEVPVAAITEPSIELQKPAPLLPEPAPEPVAAPAEPATEEAAVAEEPEQLPRTAGNLPFVALAGVLSLLAAGSVRFFGRGRVR